MRQCYELCSTFSVHADFAGRGVAFRSHVPPISLSVAVLARWRPHTDPLPNIVSDDNLLTANDAAGGYA